MFHPVSQPPEPPLVLVAGSANVDRIYALPADRPTDDLSYVCPVPRLSSGGHGANCAVSAKRFGGAVSLISAVGADPAGRLLLESLAGEGVNTDLVEICDGYSTGEVLIPVFNGGYKFMIFSTEVRARIGLRLMGTGAGLPACKVLVIMDVERGLRSWLLSAARRAGVRTIVGYCESSPFTMDDVLESAAPDIVVGNRNELSEDFRRLAVAAGTSVVTTDGERGYCLRTRDGDSRHAGVHVRSVDAVGAGDCFTGITAACLARGIGLSEALSLANVGAALSTMHSGAQGGCPSGADVRAFMEEHVA